MPRTPRIHDEAIRFRMPRDLSEELRRLARSQERSVAAEIRLALSNHLEREQHEQERRAA